MLKLCRLDQRGLVNDCREWYHPLQIVSLRFGLFYRPWLGCFPGRPDVLVPADSRGRLYKRAIIFEFHNGCFSLPSQTARPLRDFLYCYTLLNKNLIMVRQKVCAAMLIFKSSVLGKGIGLRNKLRDSSQEADIINGSCLGKWIFRHRSEGQTQHSVPLFCCFLEGLHSP